MKREAKIKENYDRISAALVAHDSKTNKNPTRIIPDVPGTASIFHKYYYGDDVQMVMVVIMMMMIMI